jgi:cyclase
MKSRVRLVTLLSVAMFGAYAYAQLEQQPSTLNLVTLADDLYVIHNDFVPGNVTALVTDSGVLLVDDKYEVDHDNILAQLKTVTSQPVRYVINTHYHGDHSGGNARLQAQNAQVVASERARAKMVESRQPGLPDITVEGRGHVYLGGKRAELYYFGRSHTDGDLVVLFPDHRVLAAGDMFTFGDATPELIDYAGGGSAKDWTSTLDGALRLDFDRVVPGHGDVTTKTEMRRFRDSTLALRTRVHDMLGQNAGRDAVEEMLRRDYHWADLHVQLGLDGLIAELR